MGLTNLFKKKQPLVALDSSLKQEDSLRYHARDVAVMRAKLSGCPVVLGSATPSLESWYNARRQRYSLLKLPQPALSLHPLKVEVVPIHLSEKCEKAPLITTVLYEAVKKCLSREEQCLILYNKRGFASYLQCELCGDVVNCPNCSVTMVYYRRKRQLLCHYCGLSNPPPRFCIRCEENKRQMKGETGTRPPQYLERGAGTERIGDDIAALFPEARIGRLDRDAVTTFTQLQELLADVRAGKLDIVIGTQMLAKGHDLPNVTLVGVVDCDIGLHFPDFRASEKIFQLLIQIAGRAGRAEKGGIVVFQTYRDTHPVIELSSKAKIEEFVESELKSRREARYPPFSRLVRVVVSSPLREKALETTSEIQKTVSSFILQNTLKALCLGPAPAPFERIKTLWRFHLLLKCKDAKTVSAIVPVLSRLRSAQRDIKIIVDVDPIDML